MSKLQHWWSVSTQSLFPKGKRLMSAQGRLSRGGFLLQVLIVGGIVLIGRLFVDAIYSFKSGIIIPSGTDIWIVLFGMIHLAVAFTLLLWFVVGTVRRLHDVNHSAALAFLYFIPLAGTVLDIYLLLKPGVQGSNEHGPNPIS